MDRNCSSAFERRKRSRMRRRRRTLGCGMLSASHRATTAALRGTRCPGRPALTAATTHWRKREGMSFAVPSLFFLPLPISILEDRHRCFYSNYSFFCLFWLFVTESCFDYELYYVLFIIICVLFSTFLVVTVPFLFIIFCY